VSFTTCMVQRDLFIPILWVAPWDFLDFFDGLLHPRPCSFSIIVQLKTAIKFCLRMRWTWSLTYSSWWKHGKILTVIFRSLTQTYNCINKWFSLLWQRIRIRIYDISIRLQRSLYFYHCTKLQHQNCSLIIECLKKSNDPSEQSWHACNNNNSRVSNTHLSIRMYHPSAYRFLSVCIHYKIYLKFFLALCVGF